MRTFLVVALLAAIVALAQAFVPRAALPKKAALAVRSKLAPFQREAIIRFSTEEEDVASTIITSAADDRKLTFDNNMRSRKGRTTDEDGKSNIWAYEAKEEVEVTKGSSGLIVLGLVLALFVGLLSFLPQLQFPSYD